MHKTLIAPCGMNYGMSVIENLQTIKNQGMDYFLKEQKQKYVNAEGTLCVHDQKRY
jgi:hypothetical protein